MLFASSLWVRIAVSSAHLRFSLWWHRGFLVVIALSWSVLLAAHCASAVLSSSMRLAHVPLAHRHGHHLVQASPWPLCAGLCALCFALGLVGCVHGFTGATSLLNLAGFAVLLVASLWWRDVLREGLYEGVHTVWSLSSLRLGMLLFIASEAALFFAFFWAYLGSAVMPNVHIGCQWPPDGVMPMAASGVPAVNTVVLLCSGASLTCCHHAVVSRRLSTGAYWLWATLFLAVIFTLLQAYEYLVALFTLADGAYGSGFYCCTGLHGAHVVVGTLCLLGCVVRMHLGHFTAQRHLLLECGAWYWHSSAVFAVIVSS